MKGNRAGRQSVRGRAQHPPVSRFGRQKFPFEAARCASWWHDNRPSQKTSPARKESDICGHSRCGARSPPVSAVRDR